MGYGFSISDIRVTPGDGREVNCLQNIYPVGRYLAAIDPDGTLYFTQMDCGN
jgi:hypothetical protein